MFASRMTTCGDEMSDAVPIPTFDDDDPLWPWAAHGAGGHLAEFPDAAEAEAHAAPPAAVGDPAIEATTASGRTTAGGLDLDQILKDRPDVFQAYWTEFYGAANDRNSTAWDDRIGGETPQDYANYWYEKYGRFEGYTQAGHAPAEDIDLDRLLRERPDVFQAYFTEYYGDHNDRHSSAWADRVGGVTVQDYARYWYDHYGRHEGYSQRAPAAPGEPDPPAQPDPDYHLEDPSLDPWNHPVLYPDAVPPESVGQSPPPPDPFG